MLDGVDLLCRVAHVDAGAPVNQPPRPPTMSDVLSAVNRLSLDVGMLITEMRRVRNSEIPKAMRAVEQSNHDWSATLAGVKEHTGRLSSADIDHETAIAEFNKWRKGQDAARAAWTRKRLVAIGAGSFVATLLYNLGMQVIR